MKHAEFPNPAGAEALVPVPSAFGEPHVWDGKAWRPAEIPVQKCNDPHLGLATTEKLLEELICRGHIQTYANENQASGRALQQDCQRLLDELPPAMRAYRTVD